MIYRHTFIDIFLLSIELDMVAHALIVIDHLAVAGRFMVVAMPPLEKVPSYAIVRVR